MIRAVAALLVCAAGPAFSQPAAPRFEVASIKPSAAAEGSSGWHTRTSRLVMNNVNLKQCIMIAYGVKDFQVTGGPKWMEADRYDINAKAEDRVPDKELPVMLRGLLSERFQLAFHRESKMSTGYVLEVAKAGPKMQKSSAEGSSSNTNRGKMTATGMGMSRMADQLARILGMPVEDKTGLEGRFDFTMEWTPDSATQGKPGADGGAGNGIVGPSIFTALQQLGLKLETQKSAIDILVVDRAEKPSEN